MRAELNEKVMYPFRLFDDIGCGTIIGILPEDFNSDQDIDKIVDKVLEEEYRDPELDKLLPDLSLYTGDLTSTMVEVNRKIKERRYKNKISSCKVIWEKKKVSKKKD